MGYLCRHIVLFFYRIVKFFSFVKELSVVLKAIVFLNPRTGLWQGQLTKSRPGTGMKSRSYSVTALLIRIMSTSLAAVTTKHSPAVNYLKLNLLSHSIKIKKNHKTR